MLHTVFLCLCYFSLFMWVLRLGVETWYCFRDAYTASTWVCWWHQHVIQRVPIEENVFINEIDFDCLDDLNAYFFYTIGFGILAIITYLNSLPLADAINVVKHFFT